MLSLDDDPLALDGGDSDRPAAPGVNAPPAIRQPQGGGALRGIGEKFAANSATGTASLTIPIPLSGGRGGFGPQLTLAYDSGAGNGPFGVGWRLDLPAITRKTDKGIPRYHDAIESDVYILSDAEDLVPMLAADGSGYEDRRCGDHVIRTHRPRVEGLFARIESSVEIQDFLRDKFTNHELYLFLQQETAALYHETYELAILAARQAQHAFNYERGYTTRKFLPETSWDTLREGLLAGERLQLAVRQMEKAYQDENWREYELTKHVSLRLNFPLAFLRLQTTGICEIELPEWLFDLDYPGHYMRRIKNVTLTIPTDVGPYTGVHCRLTLLSSTTRIDPRLNELPVACCEPEDECCDCEPCCCRKRTPNGYELVLGDTRVVKAYAATEAIATSSGQNDSGLFELSFRDERYLPFEFAGAVSRWRIELPLETNYFDFDTLSGVVLRLNYTAREGGEVLRAAGGADARCRLPGDGLRLIDGAVTCRMRGRPCASTTAATGVAGSNCGCQPRCSRSFLAGRCAGSTGCRSSWRRRAPIRARTSLCASCRAITVTKAVSATANASTSTASPQASTQECSGASSSRPRSISARWASNRSSSGHSSSPTSSARSATSTSWPATSAEPWERCGHGAPCPCRRGGCCCGDRDGRGSHDRSRPRG